ncbi:MAG TPA: ZIP family metal transporter [Candidatus Macondimonas sp.]|nr:ZIP family metal transporter [Candidatus Macondimonas sp.]
MPGPPSTTQVAVLLLSLLSLFTTWLGVMLAVRLRENARAIAAGIGFSTGIMLLISLLELVPESIGILGAPSTLLACALGAGLVWTAHLIVPHTHLVKEQGMADRMLVKSAYLVAFGLVLHDVPEGFAMANAYIASPQLGVLIAIAIALHNVPEEFAMAVPAVVVRSRRFLYGAALLSALAEPLGAVIGLVAVGIAPALNAHFMAFAAGAMIFVSLHELVPMARRYRNMAMFAAGMLLSAPNGCLDARRATGHGRHSARLQPLRAARRAGGQFTRPHRRCA